MYITNNINALTIQKYTCKESKTMKNLSSGLRINTAADDAAGLSISEKMRAQIRGLAQAEENVQDAISLVQTAEGGLGEIHSMLARMRELAVQSANGSYTDTDRQYINDEIEQLKQQIDNIAHYTEFNTIKLLDGSLDKPNPPSPEPEPVPPPEPPEPEPPEPEPIPPSPPTPPTPVLPPNIIFNTSKNKYAGTGIKAERIDNVDFSKIEDGSMITIQGVKFEFDTDGVINSPDALVVDISALSGNDYIGFANELQKAFESSSLYSGISSTPPSKYLDIKVEASDPTNSKMIKITIKDGLGDFIDKGKGIEITYYPTNQSLPPKIPGDIGYKNISDETDIETGLWATRVDYVDFSTIGDGSIISIEGVNFEFDNDGIVESGSETIDISHISGSTFSDLCKIAEEFQSKVNSYNLGNGILITLGKNLNSGMNIEIDYDDWNFMIPTGDNIKVEYYPSTQASTTSLKSDNSIKPSEKHKYVNPTAKQELLETENISKKNTQLRFDKTHNDISESIINSNYGIIFQIGANTGISLKVTIEGATSECLGINDAVVTTIDSAGKTITSVDNAISKVSDTRAKLGAVQNRLESTFNNLFVAEENLTAAESRIRDYDYSKEMVSFFKQDVMTQVAQTMLAQANEEPKNVLQLLK